MPELTKEQRDVIVTAIFSLSLRADELKESNTSLDGAWCDDKEKVQYDAEVSLISRLRVLLAAHSAETDGPWCQSCGDGLTAHDPGICGNCFAMQYRDQPIEQRMSDAENAARYRWLRRQAVAVKNYAGGNPNWEIDWQLRGESFDAAIDAARKATAPRTPAQDGVQ